MTKLANLMNDESGAAAAEYALILGFIAAVIVVGLGALGTKISAAIANATIAAALSS